MPGENDKVIELEGQVTELTEQIADLTKKLKTAMGTNDRVIKSVDLQEQINTLTKQVETLTKSLETTKAEADAAKVEAADAAKVAEFAATLSPEDLEIFNSLDKAKKNEYMEEDEDERERRRKEMKAKKSADPSIVLDGQTIFKSKVGDGVFEVLKAQAKKQDDLAKDLAAERDKRELAEYTKRADSEFDAIPGDTAQRASMLKAIDKMEKADKDAFTALLVAHQKLAKGLFSKTGHSSGKSDDEVAKAAKASTDFLSKVDGLVAANKGMKRQDAMKKARIDHPELFKAFQAAGGDTAN